MPGAGENVKADRSESGSMAFRCKAQKQRWSGPGQRGLYCLERSAGAQIVSNVMAIGP